MRDIAEKLSRAIIATEFSNIYLLKSECWKASSRRSTTVDLIETML